MSLPPCCTLLEPRPLPSAGVTRLLRYYGPLRHPAGPGWSSRIPGWRVRATVGASRVAAVSLLHACRRQYPGGTGRCCVARFPTAASLPRFNGGSASALPVSRPARRSLSLPPACSLSRPWRPFVIEVLQSSSLPPRTAPTASGWSDSCRAGFAPAGTQRLSTAHIESGADGGRLRSTWSRAPGTRLLVLAGSPKLQYVSS